MNEITNWRNFLLNNKNSFAAKPICMNWMNADVEDFGVDWISFLIFKVTQGRRALIQLYSNCRVDFTISILQQTVIPISQLQGKTTREFIELSKRREKL